MEDKAAKKGFWSRIFEDNRQFDSTISIFFVFLLTTLTISAIIGALLMGRKIPDGLFDIVNIFENFILMILSYFFTKAVTGNGGPPK